MTPKKSNPKITWACGYCKYVAKSRPKMRLHLSRAHDIVKMKQGAMPIAAKQFSRIHFRKLPLLSISQEPVRFYWPWRQKVRKSELYLNIEAFDEKGDFAYSFSHKADLYDRVHRLPSLLRELAVKIEEGELMKSRSDYWSSGAMWREHLRNNRRKSA